MANVFLILRVCKTTIGLIGVLGNGLVIVVISKVHFMHTLTNAFICHQAVIDLMGSLLLVLQSNIPTPSFLPDTTASEVLCRMWIGDALLWVMFVTSTYSLLALTIERYTAIVYPYRFQVLFTAKTAAGLMAIAWILGLTLKSYSFIIYAVVDGKCVFQHLPASRVMGPLLICLQYFLPAAIMLFCYIHITVILKRNARQIVPVIIAGHRGGPDDGEQQAANTLTQQQRANSNNHQQDSLLRARRNTFKTLLIVFATFLVCWSPSQVIFFMFNVGWIKLAFDGPLNVINTVLVASNCCLNPIIYSFKYRQFRRALRKMAGQPEPDSIAATAMTVSSNTRSAATDGKN